MREEQSQLILKLYEFIDIIIWAIQRLKMAVNKSCTWLTYTNFIVFNNRYPHNIILFVLWIELYKNHLKFI